jgi:hypothetical protein
MDWRPIIAILGLALIGTAFFAVFFGLHRWHYRRPRPFVHEGATYIWVCDPSCPFWVRQFRRGHFLHPDGTPVTDAALARTLRERWLLHHVELERVDV